MSYGQKSERPDLSMELTSVIDCRSDTVTRPSKGQLISKCLLGVIVWTKIPTKKIEKNLLVFWSKLSYQKDILKLTDLYRHA